MEKEQIWPCPEVDDCKSGTPGVLLSNEIKYYAERYRMIHPFDSKLLRPAGYRLRLGENYAIGGELKKLYPEPGKDVLEIPPFEVAIISTRETINLPRFIIARWNLRVSLVYEGLLWTGALQVDPGWCGPLYCPIYNLSSVKVTLKLDEPIVLMDFVKTTPFEKESSEEYGRPPKRKTLRDYNYRLKSALFTEAGQKIDKIEKRIDKIENKVDRVESDAGILSNRVVSFAGILFTCIAILFAALALLVTSRNVTAESSSPPFWFVMWVLVSLALSVTAFATALFKGRLEVKSRWLRITLVIFLLVFLVLSYFVQSNYYEKIETKVEKLRSSLSECQSAKDAKNIRQ